VDAGRVSHVITEHLSKAVATWTDVTSARTLLAQAHQGALQQGAEDKSLVGSSTACVALLTPLLASGEAGLTLDVANLGDSGLVVYRSGVTAFASTPTHAEPTGYVPNQLAVIPPQFKGSGAVESDARKDSWEGDFMLQQGDWIVLGSDGIHDNLNMDSLGPALNDVPDSAGPVAAEIVQAALQGPKVDDITAVAVFVQQLVRVPPISRL
jgi:serine/threonine protein phosphatase PrpC